MKVLKSPIKPFSNIQVPGNSDTPGPEYCPRIESASDATEILVSSGKESSIRVKVIHLQVVFFV